MPELDDQISQNELTLTQLKASLQQAEANVKLAQVTWDRDRPLVSQGWATQQHGTVDVQTVKADEAAVAAAQQSVAAQENLIDSSVRTGTTPWSSPHSTASSPSATSMSAV